MQSLTRVLSVRGFVLALSASVLAAWMAAPARAAAPASPDEVKMGLRILASVYGDMDRKLAREQYDRLPHENQEFQEGSQALKDAIAKDDKDFKARVEGALGAALTAANHVAEVSKSHDKARVQAALDALAKSMRKLNALFPESLRSEPGTVAPPHP